MAVADRAHRAPRRPEFEPDLVLISAGFDAHRDDPLAGCRLDATSFAEMARVSGPGGFHPRALAEPYVTVSRHTAPTVRSVAFRIRQ